LTVVLKRVLSDCRQADEELGAPAAAPVGDTSYPVTPDLAERRLGWFLAAAAIAVVVVLAATLSKLPGLRESPDQSLLGAPPGASVAGDAPVADDARLGPAGSTPTGSVEGPVPVGGPGNPAAAPGAPGGPLTPTAAGPVAGLPGPATAARGGTTAPQTTAPAATDTPHATANPVPTTDLPPAAQVALAELSAAIRQQVIAGQFDPDAGTDLQGKVHQVAREVSDGDWAAARYYAGRIREKLRKYRDDGRLTSTGYQTLIARLDVLDDALA
jgi:hypothetical protein